MTVAQAIADAERVLPGHAAPDGAQDPRWQAIITVGEFVRAEPDSVWSFVERWGAHDDPDLRMAIATCLLEHLLEQHSETIRPRAEAAARRDVRFARTLRSCWTANDPRPSAVDARTITIVAAEPSDAETILALQRLAYQSEARRYNDWTIPPLVETLDAVRAHIERDTVLKAVDGGRIAGAVRGVVSDAVCEVQRLIVHPDRQRRGIGSALLDAIEARFPDVAAFELFTGDRSVENLRLYERHGYRRFKTEPVSPAVSLVFLRKPARSTEELA